MVLLAPLHRQLVVRLLDLARGGGPRHAEDFVVVDLRFALDLGLEVLNLLVELHRVAEPRALCGLVELQGLVLLAVQNLRFRQRDELLIRRLVGVVRARAPLHRLFGLS